MMNHFFFGFGGELTKIAEKSSPPLGEMLWPAGKPMSQESAKSWAKDRGQSLRQFRREQYMRGLSRPGTEPGGGVEGTKPTGIHHPAASTRTMRRQRMFVSKGKPEGFLPETRPERSVRLRKQHRLATEKHEAKGPVAPWRYMKHLDEAPKYPSKQLMSNLKRPYRERAPRMPK